MPTTHKQTEPLTTQSSARIWGVLPDAIDQVWPDIEPLVKMVTDRDQMYSPEDIKSLAEEERIQLWTIYTNEGLKAFVATQIVIYPKSKSCLVFLCAGEDVEQWVTMLSPIEYWAKSIECTHMEILGRPGWERFIKNYKKTDILLKRKL